MKLGLRSPGLLVEPDLLLQCDLQEIDSLKPLLMKPGEILGIETS